MDASMFPSPENFDPDRYRTRISLFWL